MSEDKTKGLKTEVEYMSVVGRFEQIEADKGIFYLNASRLKIRPKEYLPSSESFRVEVMSPESRRIWQSNFGKNYFTVIGDVKPIEIGETNEFQLIWNFKNNEGKKLPAGNFKAKLIIPSSPEIYYTIIDFTIK